MTVKKAYTAIALPADLSEEIDTVAKGLGLHRSEFVEQVITEAIQNYNQKKRRLTVFFFSSCLFVLYRDSSSGTLLQLVDGLQQLHRRFQSSSTKHTYHETLTVPTSDPFFHHKKLQ